MNGSICEVDKGRQHLGIPARMVKRTGIPQRENGADELNKVFLPPSIRGWTAACILSVPRTKPR